MREIERPRKAKKKRRRSPLRYRLEHALFRFGTGAVDLLPRGAVSSLSRLASRLFLSLARSRRRTLLGNLLQAFPEKPKPEIAAIARASVENFGAALIDFLEISGLTREELLARVTWSGEEHLTKARARGKGVLLLTAHLGSWEVGVLAAGLLGGPIAGVLRPLDNPLLEAELSRRRTRFGNRPIQKREALREVVKAMRRNESVAILMDQNVLAREALFVPFFGRLAATTPSVALIQFRTDAAVVPFFTWPVGHGRHRIGFEPPILAEEFAAGAGRNERMRLATTRYTRVTEEAIRREPAAWLWIHNRWRTRPPA